uniref:Prolow-density lipoprotein receptor-related protein 1 n=1 Tax=Sipha flava TaxID=143950 RepID=A0A2S2QLY8_9HEMI
MMHMVEEFEPDMLFDCIWLFRIPHKYYNFKSQYLYMKVITLKDLIESNLNIQEGLTSNGRTMPWKNGSYFKELVVPIDVGYYVRLTGTFNSSSRLEIAYAAFSQLRACSITNEFLCKNGRCIPNRLKCDSFDHCGDNSDESADCFEAHDGKSEYMENSWYAYKSNYYFPNNTLYSKQYQILLGCFIGR